MKAIIYYLLLLVLIALTGGYVLFGDMDKMGMSEVLSVCGILIFYTIAMSFVGETNNTDERDIAHRNIANRVGLIAGNVVFSLGLIYQLFVNHSVDWWLLAGLIVINLTKIVSLIFLETKK